MYPEYGSTLISTGLPFKKILPKVMIAINKIACKLGYEDCKNIRIDSTSIATDIHYPTNNSLVYDSIKSVGLFFENLKKKYSKRYETIGTKQLEAIKVKRVEAKKINFKLNNALISININ
jgi:hypothetical protein